jgi:hypothetical protein
MREKTHRRARRVGKEFTDMQGTPYIMQRETVAVEPALARALRRRSGR